MSEEQRLSQAEACIREQDALYRHYHIEEVQQCVEQFTRVSLTDDEAVSLVSRIRDEHGMGPIEAYNLPDFVSEDEQPSEPTRPWWKLW